MIVDTLALLLRVCATTGGIVMIYAAFLRENELTAVQAALEELWIEIDDLRAKTTARHKSFILVLCKRLIQFLDALFGPRGNSFQNFSASVLWGTLTLTIGLPLFREAASGPLAAAANWNLRAFCAGCLMLWMIRRSSLLTRGLAWLVIVAAACASFNAGPATLLWAGWVIINIPLVRWTRRALGWVVQNESLIVVCGVIAVECGFIILTSAVLVAAATSTGAEESYLAAWYAAGLCLGAIDVMIVGHVALLAIAALTGVLLLLHRLAWGVIDRLSYSLQMKNVAKQSSLLFAVGLALLAGGVWPQFADVVRAGASRIGMKI